MIYGIIVPTDSIVPHKLKLACQVRIWPNFMTIKQLCTSPMIDQCTLILKFINFTCWMTVLSGTRRLARIRSSCAAAILKSLYKPRGGNCIAGKDRHSLCNGRGIMQ